MLLCLPVTLPPVLGHVRDSNDIACLKVSTPNSTATEISDVARNAQDGNTRTHHRTRSVVLQVCDASSVPSAQATVSWDSWIHLPQIRIESQYS
ncbi:hypothetical protein L210DRAFT_415407 [Boletus edulis BED1]|uniref:Uncharacterized protein n=1 Tax=Boletus edulis BED1 TaxID=1328754 RepID=A0AAD4BCR2_BOLED|nr:hypothetical protein L210DRAFT_415407 [Boletus edulis BED1]